MSSSILDQTPTPPLKWWRPLWTTPITLFLEESNWPVKSTWTPLLSMWWKSPTKWRNSEMCKMRHIFTTCFFKLTKLKPTMEFAILNLKLPNRDARRIHRGNSLKFHWGWPDSEIDWFSQLFIHENRNTTSLMPTMGALILNEVRIEPISTHNSPRHHEKETCVK